MGHTSHAIVGEPLAELIDYNEEDAQGVAKDAWLQARDRQRELRDMQHRLTLLTATHSLSKLSTDSAERVGTQGLRGYMSFCGITLVYLKQESILTFPSWSPELYRLLI